jgi:DnaJ-class molecular chaperone
MPRRDLYGILGVPTRAAPGEIKRAYRRIAFEFHPDVGKRPDPERFREAHEAYEILNDPNQRRSYDIKLGSRRQALSAEPLRSRAPVTIIDDFLTLRPSIDELLDHIELNFFGYPRKSGGPYHRLGVEAVLEADEARFGCRVPFNLPAFVTCPSCGGVGEWLGICPVCYGQGIVESRRQIVLEIPPGSRDGSRYEVDLGNLGISNLLLDVRVVVP